MKQHQIIVPTTQGAIDALNAFRIECHKKMCAVDADGDVTNNLWSKAAEIAGRVALTVACGRNFDAPEVARCDVEYATALVRYCVTTFTDEIRGKLASTAEEKASLKILEVLEKAGKKGLTQSQLYKRTQRGIKLNERKAAMEFLLASKGLVSITERGRTKPTVKFFHPDYAPKGYHK